MKMSKKTMRLTLLGVLAGGLLLLGMGLGVATTEFSKLSFGGTVVPSAETKQLETTVKLEQEAVQFHTPGWGMEEYHGASVITDETVKPGTLELSVDYRAIPALEMQLHSDTGDDLQYLILTTSYLSAFTEIMSCKDQVLEDLRSGKLCNYTPYELREVTIRVHPKDAGRLHVNGSIPAVDAASADVTSEF